MGGVDSNGVGANHIQQAGGAHTESLLVLIKQLHDHHNRYQRQQQRDSLCYASAFASLAVETSNASDMPEHESVIHRIQSIHYQQTIFTH